ncbi:ATP-dependent DNA helicase [Trichonephila clavipes]|nr:ATP-dependent DNA helicase [Trichonephila clavipes]
MADGWHTRFKNYLIIRQAKKLQRATSVRTVPMGTLLQQCKLIEWDVCTMSHKRAIEELDSCLQDIQRNGMLMGGVVVLLAGDFRQTLPVIEKGTAADETNAYLKIYRWKKS